MGEEEGQEREQQARELYQKRLQAMQLEMQKRELLKRMLSDTAYERMMNVRLSSPELYEKVVNSLAYLAQSGKQLGEKISDEQIYALLRKMTEKRETSIEFKKK